MATFQLLTPDQHQLTFEKLSKSQLINRINQEGLSLATDKFPRQVRESVYLNLMGQCLYLYESRNYGHLFAAQTDFEQSITGNTYTDSILLYDKQEQLRCAFELNFDAALPLMSQYIAIDTSYPPSDNYVVYRYVDESVCYVAFYSHPIQRQGWWFANLADFEYFYYHVFTC